MNKHNGMAKFATSISVLYLYMGDWLLCHVFGVWKPSFISKSVCMRSEYVNTRPLARGDLILPADQWILNLLTRIGNLILVAKFCPLKF